MKDERRAMVEARGRQLKKEPAAAVSFRGRGAWATLSLARVLLHAPSSSVIA